MLSRRLPRPLASLRPPLLLCRHCSMAPKATQSVVSRRLRSPVTWASAAGTLAALYAAYDFQYRRQMNKQRMVGRPDLGGPFELQGVDGKTVTNADFLGQWTLLYFGFTKCPDICPQEMDKVTAVMNNLDARGLRIQPVFITIDPARDTGARLKDYFKSMDFHERFLPLTGSFDAVKRACRAYRVYFSKPTPEEVKAGDYLIDHSIISYLVDPEGNFAEYYGKSLNATEMESRMANLMTEWERERYWKATLPSWLFELAVGTAEPIKRK